LVVVGSVVAVVVAAVLTWTLTDGPPRPRLVPTETTTPRSGDAATVVVSTVYRPHYLPAGFVLVSERGGPAEQIAAVDGQPGVVVGDAYVLHYERRRDDAPPDSLDVLTVERPDDTASDATSDAAEPSRAAGSTGAVTTIVRVHDRDALEVTTTLPGPVRTLTWTEAPGLRLRVVATGNISVDDLHAIAESLAAD
jgi:hypothetical protein